jgi:hypothetical protein
MNVKRILSIAGVIGLLAGPAFAGSATAEEPSSDLDQLLSVIDSVAPESLESVAATESTVDEAVTYSTELTTVEVPRAADEVTTLGGLKHDLQISLPFAEQASDGVVGDDGITVFDNLNSSVTVPIVHEDGSLQILTVIEAAGAPTRYDYNISVPTGGSMQMLENGGVLVTDTGGHFVGAIAPAWAKDASGNSLPTRYEIDGETLTQIIEHTAATEYPVVADPWLGVRLFNSILRGTWRGDYTYNATMTTAGIVILSGGGSVGGYLAGQAVFRGDGWTEWVTSWPAITNKPTLQQQYNCHVLGGAAALPFTGAYNLERAQTNRPNWPLDVSSHHCNWTP